jgi:hypothetical protein
VEEARLGPDMLRDVRQKGDDVMLHLSLDRVDAFDLESAALPHSRGRFLRHDAELCHRIERVRLDLEPDAETGLGGPDGAHQGPRVTSNHDGS